MTEIGNLPGELSSSLFRGTKIAGIPFRLFRSQANLPTVGSYSCSQQQNLQFLMPCKMFPWSTRPAIMRICIKFFHFCIKYDDLFLSLNLHLLLCNFESNIFIANFCSFLHLFFANLNLISILDFSYKNYNRRKIVLFLKI